MNRCFKALAAVAFLYALPCTAMATGHLRMTLTQSPDDARVGRPVVTVTLVNDGDAPMYFINQQTPLSNIDGRLFGDWFKFDTDRSGTPAYAGMHTLVRKPSAGSYDVIGAGESRRAVVDLASDYRFPQAGHFRVRTAIVAYDRLPTPLPDDLDDREQHIERSNVLLLAVRHPFLATERVRTTGTVVPCSDDQLYQLRRADFEATKLASLREQLLLLSYYFDPQDPEHPDVPPRKHMRDNPKYVYWFGRWDEDAPQPPSPGAELTDNAKVDATVHAVVRRLEQGIPTVCDLCKGYHPEARAWAEDNGSVHVCPKHFDDPIVGGITSQAATLVHEASHIKDAGGPATVDLDGVSSRSTAHALQRSQAVVSAANYEYYLADVPLGFQAEKVDAAESKTNVSQPK